MKADKSEAQKVIDNLAEDFGCWHQEAKNSALVKFPNWRRKKSIRAPIEIVIELHRIDKFTIK